MKDNSIKQSQIQDEQYKQIVEEIATNISRLFREVRAILGGRLKQKTIITLLAHSTQLPRYQVESLLTAISEMEKEHLK